MIEVYRGIRVTHKELQELERRVGTYIHLRQHPWWAQKEGIARAYATTEPIRANRTHAIVLNGLLYGFDTTLSPCLPSLAKHPTAKIFFTSIKVVP